MIDENPRNQGGVTGLTSNVQRPDTCSESRRQADGKTGLFFMAEFNSFNQIVLSFAIKCNNAGKTNRTTLLSVVDIPPFAYPNPLFLSIP